MTTNQLSLNNISKEGLAAELIKGRAATFEKLRKPESGGFWKFIVGPLIVLGFLLGLSFWIGDLLIFMKGICGIGGVVVFMSILFALDCLTAAKIEEGFNDDKTINVVAAVVLNDAPKSFSNSKVGRGLVLAQGEDDINKMGGEEDSDSNCSEVLFNIHDADCEKDPEIVESQERVPLQVSFQQNFSNHNGARTCTNPPLQTWHAFAQNQQLIIQQTNINYGNNNIRNPQSGPEEKLNTQGGLINLPEEKLNTLYESTTMHRMVPNFHFILGEWIKTYAAQLPAAVPSLLSPESYSYLENHLKTHSKILIKKRKSGIIKPYGWVFAVAVILLVVGIYLLVTDTSENHSYSDRSVLGTVFTILGGIACLIIPLILGIVLGCTKSVENEVEVLQCSVRAWVLNLCAKKAMAPNFWPVEA